MSAKKKSTKKAAKRKAGAKKPSAKRAARKKAGKKKGAKTSAAAAVPARRATSGGLARPEAVSEATAALFPPEEIERLRLVVLTSARREEKIEALRRLAYSPLEPDAKAKLLLGRLGDADAEVRVEAAQLLRMLGLDPEVAESIRELERGEESQKLFAIDRLGRRIMTGGPLEVGAALIVFMWRLREESSVKVRRSLIERPDEAAPVIARAPERAEELVRLLVTLFATDPISVTGRGRRLVCRLGAELPFLQDVLWGEYEGTGDPHVRVFLLQLLSGLPGFKEDERLPPAIGQEIARAHEHEVGFRLLGDTMSALGDVGVKALVDVFASARLAQQKYMVRLLGDICRFSHDPGPEIRGETKEAVAALFLSLLGGHQREVRLAVLRTQLPADRDLSEETRGSLAEAFVTHVHVFGFPADIENCEHTISRAGLAAVGPLVERLGPHSSPAERTRAARILGQLAQEESELHEPAGTSASSVEPRISGRRADGGVRGRQSPPADIQSAELRKTFLDILRTLQRYSLDPEFPDPAAVFTAMGKVASTPTIPVETVELIARNLMERREDEELGDRVLEGLGFIAGSPHVTKEHADRIEEIFREQLTSELPDLSTEEGEEEGVAVFAIGEEARIYTEAVPAAVMGLAHTALGRKATSERTSGAVEFLLDRWEKVITNELDWGPPGSGALTEALKRIACSPRVDVEHKTRIVRALAKRVGHLSAMEALSDIFASEDRSVDLGRLAAAVGVGLLRRRVEGEFREDERETALRVLGRIAMRATLEVGTDLTKHLREDAVEELFAGLRDGVPGAYEALARMRSYEGLPEKLREGISERLSAYESLVLA